MKTSILFLFLFLGWQSCSEKLPNDTASSKNEDNQVYTFAEETAEFSGGNYGLGMYVEKNIILPESVSSGKIEAFCYIAFIVEKDGSLTNIKIHRGVADCPECDTEALRLVSSMPKWKPAKMNGEVVRSSFFLPIAFDMDFYEK